MSGHPSFLPAILSLEGAWEVILEKLYEVFRDDFKTRQLRHESKRVFYDGRILPSSRGKEEGFWHLITREDLSTKVRLPDFDRAARLPWARPIIESNQRPEIIVFDYAEGPRKKGIRRYLWLKDWNYLVIMQHRGNVFYLNTAMYIDFEGKRRDLKRKYENRLK